MTPEANYNNFNPEQSKTQAFSLRRIYDSLGLIRLAPPKHPPSDISFEQIEEKTTNPKIVLGLGAKPISINATHDIELAANLVDSWSETGNVLFIDRADEVFARGINLLPPNVAETVRRCTEAAMTYFYFEEYTAQRIKRKEQFSPYEVIHYLLSRGADSIIYREVLKADGIDAPGLTAAFRIRQALWDLADDVRDLKQDKISIGANVLLMIPKGKKNAVKEIADSLWQQAKELDVPIAMSNALSEEYEKTLLEINGSKNF